MSDISALVSDSPSIEYATAALDEPADRLLRQIVSGVAIVDGATAIVGTVVHLGLAMGWLTSPSNMGWELGGRASRASLTLATLISIAFVVGGLLLLRRMPGAVVTLRICVIASLLLTIFGYVIVIIENPDYATYWSTPGTAIFQSLQVFRQSWFPILVGLLTLPPLARRIV